MVDPFRNQNRFSLQFNLCRMPAGDKLLKRILLFSISVLFSHIPRGAIKDIQITGSVANGEGTVITDGSETVSSDLDLLVYLKFQHYMSAVVTGLGERLSGIVTSHLLSRGIKTHVSFTLYSGIVRKFEEVLQTSAIYDYEFSHNKSLMRTTVSRRIRLPSREDALQLLFTIIAEHSTLYKGFDSQMERLYWITKRYLTLIYSILIFQGRPGFTYEGRVRTAIGTLPPEILSLEEQKLVTAFLKFKLTGNPSYVYRLLQMRDLRRITTFLEKKLLSNALRILRYQFAAIYPERDNRSRLRLRDLLNLYFARTKKSIFDVTLYLYILSLVLLVKKRSDKKSAVKIVSMGRHSLLTTANYLMSLKSLDDYGNYRSDSDLYSPVRLTFFSSGSRVLEKLWILANELKYIH